MKDPYFRNVKKTLPTSHPRPLKKAKDSLRKGYRNPTESLGEVIARTVKALSFDTKKKKNKSLPAMDTGEKVFKTLEKELNKLKKEDPQWPNKNP